MAIPSEFVRRAARQLKVGRVGGRGMSFTEEDAARVMAYLDRTTPERQRGRFMDNYKRKLLYIELIDNFIERHNLTTSEAAAILKASQPTISRIRNKSFTTPSLRRLKEMSYIILDLEVKAEQANNQSAQGLQDH